MSGYGPYIRTALPVLCGALGVVLYITSPLSHQAFCSPVILKVPSETVVAE